MPASVPWSLRIWLVVVGAYCSLMFLAPWQASSFSRGIGQISPRNHVETESSANPKQPSSTQRSMSQPFIKASVSNPPLVTDAMNFPHPQ
jgi:hypothetical protein